MSATDRGDLAERMLRIAAYLTCVVHGDGDHHNTAHTLQQLDRGELEGLAVVLAGLVDPNLRLDEALAYVTWDEHGRPAQPAACDPQLTLRGLIRDMRGPMLGAAQVLESERVQQARELHLGQGYTVAEVARMVGAAERTVAGWRDTGWTAA